MKWSSKLNRLLLPVAVLVFYFAVPFGTDDAPVGTLLGLLLGAASLVAVAVAVYREVRWARRKLLPIHLLLAFELVLVAFALVYYLVAVDNPAEFVTLNTRLDALYFSLTTMATVGYGDVSAAGQAARALVTFQLAFNLVFVGTLLNLMRDRLQPGGLGRARDADDGGDPPAGSGG